MKDPGSPKLHELIHRVAMCTQKDVVVNGSTVELRRESVVWTWARVKSHYGLPVIMAQSGYSIFSSIGHNTIPTHAITIRAGIQLQISAMAFIYEEFRKSPPRWYKVLGYSETDDYITMPVRMVEKSDAVLPPLESTLVARPSPVEL